MTDAKTRIYKVINGGVVALVRAPNKVAARNHVARSFISAEVASQRVDPMRAYRILKMAVEAMMAPLGYHGTISARDDRVQAVMDALHQVDEVE